MPAIKEFILKAARDELDAAYSIILP